jgi:hypothetical protein
MRLLTAHLLRTKVSHVDPGAIAFGSYLAGYFYALSPFIYNDIIGGAITQIATYAIFPLTILCYLKSLESSKFDKNAVFAAITLSLVSISFQSLALATGIIVLMTLSRVSKFLRLLQVLSLWVVFNSYWLITQVYAYSILSERYATFNFDPNAALLNLKIHTPSLFEGFLGVGYWFSFFWASIPNEIRSLWIVVAAGSVSTALFALLLGKSKAATFWACNLVLWVALATGLNGPLAPLFEKVFAGPNPVALLFYGNPQRLVSMTVLSLAILVGISAHSFVRLSRFSAKPMIARRLTMIVLLVSTSFWVFPIYSGNFGGSVDVFNSPTWYREMTKIVENSKAEGARILYLPMSHSPLYQETDYQRAGHQGGDPLVDTSPLPTIATDVLSNQGAQQASYALINLLYGDFSQFYVSARSNITLEHSGFTSLRLRITNRLEHPATLMVNIYDLNRFIPNTANGFVTLRVANGQPLSPGQIFELEVDASLLSGFLVNDVLQASLIREDGLPLETSNKLIYGYILPSSPSHAKLLAFFNVKYVVLRRDVTPNFGPFSPNGPTIPGLPTESWNYSRAFEVLSQSDGLRSVRDWGVASLWINDYYLPTLIYPATDLKLSSQQSQPPDSTIFNAISSSVLSSDFQIGKTVLAENGTDTSPPERARTANFRSNVTVEFTRDDPTKLSVRAHSDGPFILVFSEIFDRKWSAFIGDPGWALAPFSASIAENNHFVANGFSNAWLIEKSGDFTLTLYYLTQSVVYYGWTVSLAAVIICLALLARRRRILRHTIIHEGHDKHPLPFASYLCASRCREGLSVRM